MLPKCHRAADSQRPNRLLALPHAGLSRRRRIQQVLAMLKESFALLRQLQSTGGAGLIAAHPDSLLARQFAY